MGGECFTISRAVFVRVMFTGHGLFSIYRLYVVTQDPNKWYLTTALMGLLMETSITIYKKRGQEWKWSVDCLLQIVELVVASMCWSRLALLQTTY